jgi:hypothetical protein
MSVPFYVKILYEKLERFALRLLIPQFLDIPQRLDIELKQKKKTDASFYGTTAITLLKVAYC